MQKYSAYFLVSLYGSSLFEALHSLANHITASLREPAPTKAEADLSLFDSNL